MNHVLRFSIAFAAFFIGTCAYWGVVQFSPIVAAPSERESVKQARAVSDEDQLEIVKLILQRWKPETGRWKTWQENTLYLASDGLPDLAIKQLPREKFSLKLRILGKAELKKFDFSYLVINGWSRDGESISVTQTAHFRGGNFGGCNERYSKTGAVWKLEKSECFAVAS